MLQKNSNFGKARAFGAFSKVADFCWSMSGLSTMLGYRHEIRLEILYKTPPPQLKTVYCKSIL